MHKAKRNEKIKRFKSVNGHSLELNIVQRRLCLNINIQNTDYYVCKNIWWSTIICIFNLCCYILHIISFQNVVVIGFIFVVNAVHQIVKEGIR